MSKIFLPILLLGGIFLITNTSSAATADHVVVSQIQIDGVDGSGGTEDDWVELYNPTANAIDLSGWSIQKTSKTGGSLYRKELEGTIPAHGYFLIVRNHAETSQAFKNAANVLAAGSGFSLSNDNIVYLVNNNENITGASDPDIIDLVGMGQAQNFEAAAAPNPAGASSLERKPGSGQGNGQDTDNNAEDFFIQSAPHPRNADSPTENAGDDGPQEADDEEEPEESDDQEQENDSNDTTVGGSIRDLEISEIMPNPDGKDSGNEWVEIYMNGSGQVDLSGWYIDDDAASDTPGSSAMQLPEGTLITSFQYLVIEIPSGKFALNNASGDAARIFDKEKNLRLRQYYPGPAKSDFAYAKNSQNQWDWTDIPTPGAANEFSVAVSFSKQIRINELFPDPPGSDLEGEFIELINLGDDSVDLSDWVISDPGKRYTISEEDIFDTEIAARGFFVIYREVSGISLNNFGDETITLFNPAGEIVDRLTFDARGKSSQAYARSAEGKYQWTGEATPGQTNKFSDLSSLDELGEDFDDAERDLEETEEDLEEQGEEPSERIKSIELKDIRGLNLGEKIKTKGVVVVEPGMLGANVTYLAGSGVRVFFSKLPDFGLAPGTEIELIGELSSYHNELQIKVADASEVSLLSSDSDITPHVIKTGEAGEGNEGFLVHISGQVTRSSGDTFFIDDGSGEARIYIRSTTGIEKPKLKKGQEIAIIGVVSQYDEVFRVMPRYDSDIILSGVAGATSLPRTGSDIWLILAIFLFISAFFGLNNSKNLPTG